MKLLRRVETKRSVFWVVAVAAAVQALYLYEASSSPTFGIPIVDEATYHAAAVRLAVGRRLINDAFWQPPLFPLLLGCLYRVAGPDVILARIILAGLAVASCALLYRVAHVLFDRRVALITGITIAVYGPFVFFSTQLLPTGLAVFLDLAAFAFFLRCAARPTLLSLAVFGVLVGLATITVPNACVLLIAAPLAVMIAGRSGEHGKRLACWIATPLIGFLLVLAPVTLRNYVVSGHWVMLSTNGGINLFIGNNPRSDRTVAVRPGESWRRLMRQGIDAGAWNPIQENRYFFDKAATFAKNEPVDFVAGLMRKTRRLVNAREIPRNVDPYIYRDDSVALSVLLWRWGPFGFPFGVVGPAAVVGVLVSLRQRRVHYVSRAGRIGLTVSVVGYGVLIVLFFVSSRYRLPVALAMLPFSGAGLCWLTDWGTGAVDNGLSWRVGGSAFVLAAVVMNWPTSMPTERVDFRAERDLCLGNAYLEAEKLDEAERFLLSALRRNATYAEAAVRLGSLLAARGEWKQAEATLRDAMGWAPNSAEPGVELGRVLHELDRDSEAVAVLQQAIERDPTSPKAQEELGDLLSSQKRYAVAIEHYQRALPFAEDPGSLLIKLGDAEVQMENYRVAIDRYRQAVNIKEPKPEVLNRIAWLLATCPVIELRNCEVAIDLAERVCSVTHFENASALDTLAAAYAECGQWSEAVSWSRRAIAVATQDGRLPVPQPMAKRLRAYLDHLGAKGIKPGSPSSNP